MLRNFKLASKVQEWLECGKPSDNSAIIEWLLPAVVDLSLSSAGTMVVQVAIGVANTEDQEKLNFCLRGHVMQLLESPYGNFVLQKAVVMMPPHAVKFILDELSCAPGGWAGLAKHRFGCRIEERVLEHCGEALCTPLVNAVLGDLEQSSQHPFANYVIQHILEHGAPKHQEQAVLALIDIGIPFLARQRVASNIVERAVQHTGPKGQHLIAESILQKPGALVEMAGSRYGSFTVRHLLEKITEEALRSELLKRLAPAAPKLRTSKHGRQVLARFNAALSGTSGYGVGGA
jgi:pumilio RNA-binding family